ncbi:MAG: dihydroorotate dehydrogenase [Elusimicrobiota bacterium]
MKKEIDLSITLGKLKLRNPVLAASGTFGYGTEYSELVKVSELGGVVAKTVTLESRLGNPPPRLAETPSGLLNCIGLDNVGWEVFRSEKLPALRKLGTAIIVSIAGRTKEEFVSLAKNVSREKGVAAIELNLSCPNVEYAGEKELCFAQDVQATRQIVKSVRLAAKLPLIAKLSPNVTDIGEIAKVCEKAGADILSLVNTFLGMAIDVQKRKPKLSVITGGLSGPAIRPLALRCVWQVSQVCSLPIIGLGGIQDTNSALEFIFAGASAVAVGTANFIDPQTALKIKEGIKSYMQNNGISRFRDLVGRIKV